MPLAHDPTEEGESHAADTHDTLEAISPLHKSRVPAVHAAPREERTGLEIAPRAQGIGEGTDKHGKTRKLTVRTRDAAHLIGCPKGCKGKVPKLLNGAAGRYKYACKECKQQFTQIAPTIMMEKNLSYEERDAKEAINGRQEKSETNHDSLTPITQPATPQEKSGSAGAERVGDLIIRWHNSDGIGSDMDRCRQYLRARMHKAHIIAGCESGLDDISRPDAVELAHWDRQISAHLICRGHHRTKTGMFVALSHHIDVQDVRAREIDDRELQLIIVDATIQRTPMRIVASHGPHGKWQDRQQHYDNILRNVRRINEEDSALADENHQQRHCVWMADHNMVIDRNLDEIRGTKGGIIRGEHTRLTNTIKTIEDSLGGLHDAFRSVHGEKAQDYTHEVRRIDRICLRATWEKQDVPWLAGMRHIAVQDLEIASAKKDGDLTIHRPTHKAVEVTLRFSEHIQARAPWRFTGKKYPKEIWQKAMDSIKKTNESKIAANLNVEGGTVRLVLKTNSAKSLFEQWQGEVSSLLETYERESRTKRQREIATERTAITRWERKQKASVPGTEQWKAATGILQRLEKKAHAGKIDAERRRREKDRMIEWAPKGCGATTAFDPVKKREMGGTTITALKIPVAGPLTQTETQQSVISNDQEQMIERMEQHYDASLNEHVNKEKISTPRDIEESKHRREAACQEILERVRQHTATLPTTEKRELFTKKNLLSEKNLRKAIKEVRKNTVPASDGFTTDFFAATKDITWKQLQALYEEIWDDELMTNAMREAVISCVYKQKGKDKTIPKSYRPVSITPAEYRILTRAIQNLLEPAVREVIGTTQVAYVSDGRQMRDNTLLLSELMHLINEGHGLDKGAVAIQVDNASAFDKVRWDFLHQLLDAFEFSEDTKKMVEILYREVSFRVKVNGTTGASRMQTNGIRQGCGASPLLFILVQEALLISLRNDPKLDGIKIDAQNRTLERCAADDTVIYLNNTNQMRHLFDRIGIFMTASGQQLEASKSSALLAGEAINAEKPDIEGMQWKVYGKDKADKGLGIVPGNNEQIEEQWNELLDAISDEVSKRMNQLQKTTCVGTRVHLVKGAYAAKIPYQAAIQVPKKADWKIEQTQQTLDRAVFGKWAFISRKTAYQPEEDGGYGHVDLKRRLQAEWANHVAALVDGEDAWMRLWKTQLSEEYGGIDATKLLNSTCSFRLMAKRTASTELQRRAFAAFGSLAVPTIQARPAKRAQQREVPVENGDQQTEDKKDTQELTWNREEIGAQLIFFSPMFTQNTPLSGRSTEEREEIAKTWAKAGLSELQHVWNSAKRDIMTDRDLERNHPGLDKEPLAWLRKELPWEWRVALRKPVRRISHLRRSFENDGSESTHEETEKITTIGIKETLRIRGSKRIGDLSTGDIYERLIAEAWELPTTFQEGKDAERTWKIKNRDPKKFTADVANVYRKTRHKAVPRWIQDIKYKAATETDLVGPRFFHGMSAERAKCKRCGLIDSTAHKFRRCGEVQIAWKTQLKRWENMTCQACDPTDEWVTGWGWRVTEGAAEEAAHSKQHEEVFEMLHASTIAAIHQKSALAEPGKAHAIIELADKLARHMIDDRRRQMKRQTFEDTYVGIGMIQWQDEKQERWKWAHQKPPTPEELGRNTDSPEIEIYTDGTGGKAEQGRNGGYGWVEVTEGEETTNGFGPVIVNPKQPGHLGAEISTNNTAEISAIIHALRHAQRTNKTCIVIRYDSEYAANMTRGKWKPKKGRNEKLINAAKKTLELAEMTMAVRWKHVKGHSGDKWNDRADELADRGAELSENTAIPGERVEAEDNDPIQQTLDTTPLLGITKDRSEALRIMRARTLHGTLNTSARGKELKPDQVKEQASRCQGRLTEQLSRKECSVALTEAAETRLASAERRLLNPSERRRERKERKKPRYTTTTLSRIDMNALEEMKLADGDKQWGGSASKKTIKSTIENLEQNTKNRVGTVAELRLRYKHSELGRDLLDAGHVTGSREYAEGSDPFKTPKGVRTAAWATMGEGFDDNSAYQRIKIALFPAENTRYTAMYLAHKDTIVAAYGQHLFAEENEDIQKKRMKALVNGLDMGSSETAWTKTHGNPYNRSIRDITVKLAEPRGTKTFSLTGYRWEQKRLATDLAARSPAAIDMIRQTGARRHRPEMTWQAYVLQEAEAAARHHKVEWCRRAGRRLLSLQHDGIVVDKDVRTDGATAAIQMTAYVQEAVKYQVLVKHEQLQSNDTELDPEEELWDLPPLQPTRTT